MEKRYSNHELKRLKLHRVEKLKTRRSSNLLVRGGRKFKNLMRSNVGVASVSSYFVSEVIKRIRKRLFSLRSRELRLDVRKQVEHLRQHGKVVLAFRMAGGVGDAVVHARLLRDLAAVCGSAVQIDVYFNGPQTLKFVFANLDGVRKILDDAHFNRLKGAYDASCILTHYFQFDDYGASLGRIQSIAPKLAGILRRIESNQANLGMFICNQPSLDGAFSDYAIERGLTRERGLHQLAGIAYSGGLLPVRIPKGWPSHAVKPGDLYITVHDGWDNAMKLASDRPTKAYPIDSWNLLVRLLKLRFPQLKIVQLGGETGEIIEGVDVCLRGKTKLPESVAVMKKALLHIDSESGLVHLAAAIGIPAVVLFGPTNIEYFSYPENMNVGAQECRNCWWSVDSWSDACPRGFEVPICMSGIMPQTLVDKVAVLLDRQPRWRAARADGLPDLPMAG
ncbi:glycosyltransferase family 9 protein [Chromobacterium vaccinii]|uniref:glycosyltransferase family 9 protein n=1 Tax=Chromobacterium vaccinii TaxID=1108595 RepID=UPI003C738E2F